MEMRCNERHVMLVVGARPNFIKAAPLLRALREGTRWRTTFVHTGQHYGPAMSERFFHDLQIPAPDVDLKVGSASHAEQTAAILRAFEPVVLHYRPDLIVVFGDVNSTMACALTAAKLGIAVAHVEAGLRSFDRTMPEEINRILTDALSDFCFTHSSEANANLVREGVPSEKIVQVGNIMIDMLMQQRSASRAREALTRFPIREGAFAYVTLHRPSNVDHQGRLSAVVSVLAELVRSMPVVWPIHPRTRKMIGEFRMVLPTDERFCAIEPIGYHESIALAEHARFVLTDSGGIQEETTFFRTPCLTLRPNTERPVTITVGSNRLTDLHVLREDIESTLRGPARIGTVPDGWDGNTATRIVQELASCWSVSEEHAVAKRHFG